LVPKLDWEPEKSQIKEAGASRISAQAGAWVQRNVKSYMEYNSPFFIPRKVDEGKKPSTFRSGLQAPTGIVTLYIILKVVGLNLFINTNQYLINNRRRNTKIRGM